MQPPNFQTKNELIDFMQSGEMTEEIATNMAFGSIKTLIETKGLDDEIRMNLSRQLNDLFYDFQIAIGNEISVDKDTLFNEGEKVYQKALVARC